MADETLEEVVMREAKALEEWTATPKGLASKRKIWFNAEPHHLFDTQAMATIAITLTKTDEEIERLSGAPLRMEIIDEVPAWKAPAQSPIDAFVERTLREIVREVGIPPSLFADIGTLPPVQIYHFIRDDRDRIIVAKMMDSFDGPGADQAADDYLKRKAGQAVRLSLCGGKRSNEEIEQMVESLGFI